MLCSESYSGVGMTQAYLMNLLSETSLQGKDRLRNSSLTLGESCIGLTYVSTREK